MSELVIVGFLASLGPTIAGLAAYRQARGANRAVNHQGPGELSLVEKVSHIDANVKDVAVDVALLNRTVREGANRIVVIEEAVAHISEQATEAAELAAKVKADIDLAHDRADAIPPDAEPGAAADAAVQTIH